MLRNQHKMIKTGKNAQEEYAGNGASAKHSRFFFLISIGGQCSIFYSLKKHVNRVRFQILRVHPKTTLGFTAIYCGGLRNVVLQWIANNPSIPKSQNVWTPN